MSEEELLVPSGVVARGEVELALAELRALIDDDGTEADFQSWFERHPFVLRRLGFQRAIAHPPLPVEGSRFPDFMCQRARDGVWCIFELKRADTAVLRDIERRAGFYHYFGSGLAQCREYARALLQESTRDWFSQRYSTLLQPDVPIHIVAGRSDGLDRLRVHQELAEYSKPITHHTFDEIVLELVAMRRETFIDRAGSMGVSLFATLIPARIEGRRNALFAFGQHDAHRNRICIYIDEEDRFVTEVIDANGVSHRCRRSVPVEYEAVTYLFAEICAGEGDAAVIGIEINGVEFDERQLDPIVFTLPKKDQKALVVCGSGFTGAEDSRFDFCEWGVYERVLSFEDRDLLRSRSFDRYCRPEGPGWVVRFPGSAYLVHYPEGSTPMWPCAYQPNHVWRSTLPKPGQFETDKTEKAAPV